MKRGVEKSLFVVLVAGLALGTGPTGFSALECPQASGSLRQRCGPSRPDPAIVVERRAAQVPGILGSLKEKYPGVSKPMLVNFLIAAYCPVVNAETSLSDEEKMARVREFADKAISLAY